MKRVSGIKLAAVPVILAMAATAAMANVVLFFPGPLGVPAGVPAYARIERAPDGVPLVHHDEEWAAIYFFRDPACVPPSFNLLDFSDAPAAFNCPMTVEGFEIWKNGPWTGEVAPIHTMSHGLGAVPVWFVNWPDLRAALGDDLLTMSELNSLNHLKGTASFFKETLQPFQEGTRRTVTQVVARGNLEDGRTFDFQSVENFQFEQNGRGGDLWTKTVTTIRFK